MFFFVFCLWLPSLPYAPAGPTCAACVDDDVFCVFGVGTVCVRFFITAKIWVRRAWINSIKSHIAFLIRLFSYVVLSCFARGWPRHYPLPPPLLRMVVPTSTAIVGPPNTDTNAKTDTPLSPHPPPLLRRSQPFHPDLLVRFPLR